MGLRFRHEQEWPAIDTASCEGSQGRYQVGVQSCASAFSRNGDTLASPASTSCSRARVLPRLAKVLDKCSI
eukprot:scaffold7916_cov31-Tisochrysis_lutea.AAC.6